MTARSIRRAQERKAKKLARKAGSNPLGQVVNLQADCQSALTSELDSSAEHSNSPAPISEAQLIANRENAQLSTGPTSENGKAKSSLNAVDEAAVLSEPKIQARTGLTGRTVLLPADDAAEYQRHIDAYVKEFEPVGPRECDLVQSIADTQWRLLRIPSLESGIYALGHLQFANSIDEQDTRLRPSLIEVKTFLAYERQLRNLHLQESRLQRRREKEIAELRALQSERQRKEAEEQAKVAQALLTGKSDVSRPAPNGFVFSTDDPTQTQSPVARCESSFAPANQPQSRAA